MYRDADPAHWKLLILYYNRDNPRLFVSKRSGIPWTLNFARPSAWVLTAGIIVVITAFALINN